MSTKSENLVYFKDGHVEKIVRFEILNGSSIWFITERGRSFLHQGAYPTYKFYEGHICINHEYGFVDCKSEYSVEYFITNEIEKIKLFISD